MKDEYRIPLVVGVTGHRRLEEKDRPALYEAVLTELRGLRQRHPQTPLLMLNSLAEGADQLCADAAEALDIPLAAALPLAAEDYLADFSEEGRQRLLHHLDRARQVFVTPPTEAMGEGRDWRYRQAGIYVAAHCHVLLALWDGGPGTSAACGTAEAVGFMLRGSYIPSTGVSPRWESNGAVIHIYTPRGERRQQPAGTVRWLGDREALRGVLERTGEFNRLALSAPERDRSLLPQGRPEDPVLDAMEAVYRAAGSLSGQAARRYRRMLALLAVASAVITLAFLMYDEAQAIWMILVCGLMLLFAWGCGRYARRSDCHRRYIEYRALAETLRVQVFLRYAGSGIQAAELLPWTQQVETDWIMDALWALSLGEPLSGERDIRECWVMDQQAYHRKAGGRSEKALKRSDGVVTAALFLSIGLYLMAVLFELLCGGLLFAPRVAVGDVELWRTALKILLGTISAVTLFISNYYGRLSLQRVLADHGKMERFYARMSALLKERGQTEELLRVLAREELIENGNWCSYQRDNTPDLSL